MIGDKWNPLSLPITYKWIPSNLPINDDDKYAFADEAYDYDT